jgi:hypothetical protein
MAGVPFDGYIRVSRVGDWAGESYSLKTQERGILEWAQRRGMQVEIVRPRKRLRRHDGPPHPQWHP